jgi:hypothetical protein
MGRKTSIKKIKRDNSVSKNIEGALTMKDVKCLLTL